MGRSRRYSKSGGFRLSLLHIDQPAGPLVILAGGLFENLVILFDVVQALADLDQPDALEAGDAGAVNAGRAALAVVALAVPAAEGEGDLFLRLGEEGLSKKPPDFEYRRERPIRAVSRYPKIRKGLFFMP